MKLIGATASDVGNVREANQDRAFFRGPVAALADGMGGHQGGERAAELAIGEFEENRRHLSEGDLVEIMISANRHVHGHAGDHGLPGMGTTLVALTLHDDETITVANVGDSRAYWLRTGHMSQITEDHSFVEDLVRQGRLTPEEAAVHPQRNILTRAVGIGAEVEVDRFPIDKPLVGDRFLLCSDGLFNEVSEDEILEILMATDEPQEAADALVAAALATPCRDNVTVTVVDVVADDDERVVPAEEQDEIVPVDPDKTTTAPMPVVSKSVVKDVDTGENGQKPKPVPPERKSARGAGTLVLDEQDVDHREPPSVLEGEFDETPVADFEDPELFEETTELEIVDAPDEVGTRKSMIAAIAGGLVVVALLAGGYLALRAYAGSSYFIADENEQLVIFQGRRGGFLWFDPVDVGRVDVSLSDLSDAEVATIEQREFDSRAEADELATSLQQRQQAEEAEVESDANSVDTEVDPNAATDAPADGAGSETRSGRGGADGGEADEVDVTDAVTDDSTAPNNEG